MKFISVCSGIEAASEAWVPLGWQPQFYSEIEKFPSAVLEYRHPDVPNLGDMTKFKKWNDHETDVLVGGTPCQSFSFAGLRKGLDDPRGNLMLTYLSIADRYRPRWLVWENVPGVLSSGGGRDFGTFLWALGQLGYGWAYRVLDAQYFGVPQRRRRVFVVGCLGGWQPATAVLFERHSLSGHPAPSTEKRKGATGSIAACLRSGGDGGVPSSRGENLVPVRLIANTLKGKGNDDHREDSSNYIVVAHGQGNAEIAKDGSPSLTCNLETPILAFPAEMSGTQCAATEDVSPCLSAHHTIAIITANTSANGCGVSVELANTLDQAMGQCVAFAQNTRDEVREMKVVGALAAQPGAKQQSYIRSNMQVRRLTPVECERLQGFPDNYTRIPWRGKEPENCPDGPRYKALGNSMAVPVMRWIGQRIEQVEKVVKRLGGQHERG